MKTYEEAEKKSTNPFYILWWIEENESSEVEELRIHFMLKNVSPEARRNIFQNLRQTLIDLNAIGVFESHFLFNENANPTWKNPFYFENESRLRGPLRISETGKRILKLLDTACEILAEHPPRESMWTTPCYGKIREKMDSDIFVLMPFKEELDPVFKAIEEVSSKLQRRCFRADNLDRDLSEEQRNEIMRDKVWPEIASARQIIVDLTGLNPNVFYELGIADTLGKSVIFIMDKRQEMLKTPFDITHREIHKYDLNKLEEFKQEVGGVLRKKSKSESVILEEVEQAIGKTIPYVTSFGWNQVGYHERWSKVTALALCDCELNNCELPESLGNLDSLQTLILCDNKLQTLPVPILQLKSLEKLDLSKNELRTLPEAFGDFRALTEIDLRDNELITLPNPFGQLTSLKILHLSGNSELEVLPPSFSELESLEHLDLFSIKLKVFPEPLLQLKALRKLYLGNNYLTTLPESFGQLQSLQDLLLGNNQLTGLPDSFRQLKSLRKLYLNSNQLTALPEPVCALESLEILNLEANYGLTTLPESITRLSHLKTLYIAKGRLDADSLKILARLESKGCQIKR